MSSALMNRASAQEYFLQNVILNKLSFNLFCCSQGCKFCSSFASLISLPSASSFLYLSVLPLRGVGACSLFWSGSTLEIWLVNTNHTHLGARQEQLRSWKAVSGPARKLRTWELHSGRPWGDGMLVFLDKASKWYWHTMACAWRQLESTKAIQV